MANATVKLNRSAIRDFLRGAAADAAELERRARAIADAAGDGYEVIVEVGPNRARAEVRTATTEARRREARSQTLLRALDAGRS